MKAFIAKFPGICAISKAPIYPGDMVYFNTEGKLCLQVDSDSIYFINSRG